MWQDGCGLGFDDFKSLTIVTARQYVRDMQKHLNELDGWRDDLKYRNIVRVERNEFAHVYRLTDFEEMLKWIPQIEDTIIWHEFKVNEAEWLANDSNFAVI